MFPLLYFAAQDLRCEFLEARILAFAGHSDELAQGVVEGGVAD